MLLVMAFTYTWFAPVGGWEMLEMLFPKNKVKKIVLSSV